MTDQTPPTDKDGRQRKQPRSANAPVPTTRREVAEGESIVFGTAAGPVHMSQNIGGHHELSLCGVRSQFRHTVRPGTMDDVTCTKCISLHARGETRSWGAP